MADGWQIAENERPGKWKQRPLYASLNKRGEIAMNERAFDAIRRPANVTLLYKPDQRIIGVKFPVAADRYSFPARRYGRNRKMRIIRAVRMMKQFGISIEDTIRFHNVPVVWFRNEPMLLLRLGDK